MQIFKFGGASINSYDRIRAIPDLVLQANGEPVLVVISAMGKITNALEKVAEAYYEGRVQDAVHLFARIKDNHLNLVKYLITLRWREITNQLQAIIDIIENQLNQPVTAGYNFYYDQIVSSGELLSSVLISGYLNEQKVENEWIDVRQLICTDNQYREARVDWQITSRQVQEKLSQLFDKVPVIVTQGFIGADSKGETTTLGREGSDYTAAIFANILQANSVTIWKDVPGVMNADPAEYDKATVIDELSYREIIEMSYYGAKVIHPKTIKPLQNKNIPLYVKCFTDPGLPGTIISLKQQKTMPPVIVYKYDQALLSFQTIDFSFAEGSAVNELHAILDDLRIRPNITQNTAISLLICVDDVPEKINEIAFSSAALFDMQMQRNLTLITIRHYNDDTLKELLEGKQVILEQKTESTLQVLVAT
jgi:aspartate kinase